MAVFRLILLIFLLLVGCLYSSPLKNIWKVKQIFRMPSISLKLNKPIIVGFLIASTLNFESYTPVLKLNTAVADSTGKMSTKLTARRRYLPRIVAAITKFEEFSNGKVSEDAMKTYFKSDGFQDLVRGMKLYGLSLRVGETPDDISRTAGILAEATDKSCATYASSSDGKLADCLNNFNEYKKFAKLD